MKHDDVMARAKYIFTTGRMIHEHILKIQTRRLAAKASDPSSELSLAQLHAISVVRTHSPLSMGELAEKLAISAPSASAMVDRLVEKGHLRREHSTRDRRKVVVRISPEAVKEIEAVENDVLLLFVDLVEKLGPEIIDKWCEVLSAIKDLILNERETRSGNMPAGI